MQRSKIFFGAFIKDITALPISTNLFVSFNSLFLYFCCTSIEYLCSLLNLIPFNAWLLLFILPLSRLSQASVFLFPQLWCIFSFSIFPVSPCRYTVCLHDTECGCKSFSILHRLICSAASPPLFSVCYPHLL